MATVIPSRWRVCAAVGVLLAASACSASAVPSASEPVRLGACPTGAGTPIEGIHSSTLPCLADASVDVHLSAVHGRPEVINIWASWCGPCRQEMPALQRVHEKIGSRVAFVGVDVRDHRSKAFAFLRQAGVHYPQVFDVTGSFAAELRMYTVPDTLIVDRSGHIVFRHAGPLTADQLTRALAAHLPPR